jgi:hypothetical protein
MAEKAEQKKDIGLTTNELARSAYRDLLHRLPHQEIDFGESPPASLVADDSDHHGGMGRRGVMFYDQVSTVTAGEKQWAVALGTRTRGYAANDIGFDLKAFPYEPQGKSEDEQKDEIRRTIGDSHFFQRSLVIGIAGRGMVVNDRYRPAIKIGDQLRPEFESFVAQKPKIDNTKLNLPGFGPPIMETTIRYKPEFSEVLASSISEVLQE